MSVPSTYDFTPQYLAVLPKRVNGDPSGDCMEATMCYGMEARNIIQGGVPIRISEYDLFWQNNHGGFSFAGPFGVAADALWPASAAAISTPSGTINPPPNAAAVADRPNHQLLVAQFVSTSSLADFILQAQTNISSGFPITAGYPPNHWVIAWGYTPVGGGQLLGLDSRDTNPNTTSSSYGLSYAASYGFQPWFYAIKSVAFNPPPSGGYKFMPTITVAPNGISLVGNNPTGTFTVNYSGDVNNAPVSVTVPVGTSPPPPPPPVAGNPHPADGGLVIPTNATSLTDAQGNVWTIKNGQTLINGVRAADGSAALLEISGGVAYASGGDVRYWWKWNGTSWVQGW